MGWLQGLGMQTFIAAIATFFGYPIGPWKPT
jgi:hypothetical protein